MAQHNNSMSKYYYKTVQKLISTDILQKVINIQTFTFLLAMEKFKVAKNCF